MPANQSRSEVVSAPAEEGTENSLFNQARAYLAAIIESADDAIISKNLDGIITSWNAAAERLFGYRGEEMIGQSILKIIPPERVDEEKMILGKLRSGERIKHFETIRRRKDGSLVDVSLTISPVKDASGRIIGASKIARDITERRRGEEALRRQRQLRNTVTRLQLLSDFARDLLQVETPAQVLEILFDRLADVFHLDFYFHFAVGKSGKSLHLRSCRGISEEVARKIERLEFGEAICGTVAREIKPMMVADVQGSDEPITEFIRSQGINAYICYPLVAGGRLFGTLSYGARHQTVFSEEFRETVRVLSDMIATAVARREAESALAARIQQQRVVAELGLAALREENLQTLFDRVTRDVTRTLDVDLCKVLELLPTGDALLLRAGVGWKEGLVGQGIVGAGSDSQAGYTLAASKPVIVEDLTTETRFRGPPLLHEHGVISGLSCTIVGEYNRPWGVLGAHSKSARRFNEDDVMFLQAVANVLSSIIQRKHTEQQFRLAFESAPNGMVMADEAGSIRMVNTQMERLFGYTRKEMLGQPMEMLLPGCYGITSLDQPQAFSHLPEAGEIEHGREILARRKDGSEFQVEVGLNPAKTPEGTFVLAAVTDISQRKQMEAELAKAHGELRDHASKLEGTIAERTEHLRQTIAELEGVSYSLSHDMRAPLRTIRSFSQIVLEEAGQGLGSEQRELLEKVIRSAARLDRLIQDVLLYSRVSRDTITVDTVDVETLLRQIIDERLEFQPPAAEVVLKTPLAQVRGHEAYLTQCITNLLDNAVKFVAPEKKPQVTIWSERADDEVRLWFEDNGRGIPKEAQERVFGIFQRIHDQKTYPGTGIGLAIVRRAVERLGGKVTLESSPGRGSRFCLHLQPGDS